MTFTPSELERRQVERAAHWLARELVDCLADFGDIPPRLAPAVVLSALRHAVPRLITMEHAAEWPGSLADNREQMKRGVREVLAAADPAADE